MISVESYIDNLRSTFAAIDAQALLELAEKISEAKRVVILGFRHSFYLAGYLCWSLGHARPEVRLIPRGGETLGENLVDDAEGDLLIAFAFRRRASILGRVLDAVRDAGAEVAVICDPGLVDTHGARWVLPCQSRGDQSTIAARPWPSLTG